MIDHDLLLQQIDSTKDLTKIASIIGIDIRNESRRKLVNRLKARVNNGVPITSMKECAQTTVLRWAGSKKPIINHLLSSCPAQFNRYYEPFFGSGVLFLTLSPKQSFLSDLNDKLICAYRYLIRSPNRIARRVLSLPRDAGTYYRIREAFKTEGDLESRAVMFFYLNRMCFNGVYRENRSGEFNVPIGSKLSGFPQREVFTKVARLLRGNSLRSIDFEKSISNAMAGDFVYLDPPYIGESHFRGEYGYASLGSDDINRFRSCLLDLDAKGVRFMVSFCGSQEGVFIGKGFNVKSLFTRRSIAAQCKHRAVSKELIITNYTEEWM